MQRELTTQETEPEGLPRSNLIYMLILNLCWAFVGSVKKFNFEKRGLLVNW